MLGDCTNCRTKLQLPPGAKSIRCAICQAITHIADSRSAPAPSSPPSSSSSSSSSSYQPGHVPPSAVAPSPYNHAPPGAPPHAQGRKRALIVGVSYRHTSLELEGCINDARCMKYMLTNRFKFPESSIVMLTEEDPDPVKWPTKDNMRMALYWLIQGCQPGDSLVFHFSGHGSQRRSYTGEEVDGYDQTLCPVDFGTQGTIVDDEINAILVRPLPRGARLHAIIDACHSGTVLDLPFLCRMDRHGKYIWEDHRPRSGLWKGTSGGEAILFSGCDDNQTSFDTSALSEITSTGAMTYSFIQAIEHGHGATYGSVLNAMRSTIRSTDSGSELTGAGGLVTSLVTMLVTGGSLSEWVIQEPQLTASEPFDVYAKRFSL